MNVLNAKRQPLSRRSVLRGLGGLGLALPLLDAMELRGAKAAAVSPRRIIFEFKPNGDQVRRRFVSSDERKFVFDEFLQPLEKYRDELLILNRLDKRYFNMPTSERADNHQQGGAGLAPWPSGMGDFPVGEETRTIGYVQGPSADYAIGQRTLEKYPGIPQRHLVYRVGERNNNIWNLHSHAGPAGQKNPVLPETDPMAAYARLFQGSSTDTAAEIGAQLASRKSMLDLVIAENAALTPKLSSRDRLRIEQYASALRDLERSLGPRQACQSQAPMVTQPYDDANHVVVGQAFQQLIGFALACDLTRSVSMSWGASASGRAYRNLGLEEGHHDISHKTTDEAWGQIRTINHHLWTLSTNLYDVLKATPEGDGSLWDNTLVVHWSELGEGAYHSIHDQLVVFAGGMGGAFQRGRLLDFENKLGFSEMLVTCFGYMGFGDVERFGDERLSTGGGVPGLS